MLRGATHKTCSSHVRACVCVARYVQLGGRTHALVPQTRGRVFAAWLGLLTRRDLCVASRMQAAYMHYITF